MNGRIKFIKIFLCCLFHIKGYSWFSPYVRKEMQRIDELKGGNE